MWHEVCHRRPVTGNGERLTLLDAPHDQAAVVAQFPLTDRRVHKPSVAPQCYTVGLAGIVSEGPLKASVLLPGTTGTVTVIDVGALG